MASSNEFVDFVVEQLDGIGVVRCRKMFGDYMIYVNDKPILLVCDDTVFVKIKEELADLMGEAEKGYPYEGAKEHYILDIENRELAREVAIVLESNTGK